MSQRARRFKAASVTLFLWLAGCGGENSVLERGAGIYADRCLPCHGRQGAGDGAQARFLGAKVPDLRESLPKKEDSEFLSIISKGKGLMPGFGPVLTEAEQRSVLRFVRSFK